MKQPELYVGIMSGTSLDGIDVVLMDFSGDASRLLATHYIPYPEQLAASLLQLHNPGENELHQACLIANELAQRYAEATLELLKSAQVSAQSVRAIGCHGQTIRHQPALGYTIQLCNAALLAELSGITVINDFRSRDIAAGGQGAPLVPAFHDKMLRHPSIHRVIVNIGGISNLTNLAPAKPASGFDCGPGNMLMDAWIYRHKGLPYDKNGDWAASGKILQPLLDEMLRDPYLHAVPPKSCGRDQFNMHWLESKLRGNENAEDVQATLLALSAVAIIDSIKKYCEGAKEIYLCGGGAHNQTLLRFIQTRLPETRISLTNELGIDADWLEAIAFAWLSRQTMHGLTANLPEATGARHPCILGAIHRA